MESPGFRLAQIRVQRAMQDISQLCQICEVPSISIGVLHERTVLHRASFGLRDVAENLLADSDTLYLLGSLSKSFLSATAAIAVADNKIEWHTPVSHLLSGFNPSDQNIREKVSIRDFLRHSAGFSSPQLLVIGPRGVLINSEEHFIDLMNACPTSNQDGSRYNRWWLYNNWGYGLVALALQHVFGRRYATVVEEHILKPLKLHRTIVRNDLLHTEGNIAYPYAKLPDGTFYRLCSDQWTYADHTPAMASMGMRSSVNDMLLWALRILEAERKELEKEDIETPTILRGIAYTRKGHWSRPSPNTNDQSNPAAYCMGWYKTTIPSSMLGFLSYNDMIREASTTEDTNLVLGVESKGIEVIAHNGVSCGSSSSLYTFPRTQSAIIAFANGIQYSDAAEFAAQILTQALFDLKPPVDILALAQREVFLRKRNLMSLLSSSSSKPHLQTNTAISRLEYVGEFLGATTHLSILMTKNSSDLHVRFNGIEASDTPLRYCGDSSYTFFPTSFDSYLTDSMLEWNNSNLAALHFARSESGVIAGLFWQWDHEGSSSWFAKQVV